MLELKIKKFIIYNLLFTIIFFVTKQAMAQCESNYSALVFNKKNQQILFENRAEEIIYPASLTKIMTLYLVFEALEQHKIKLQQQITISANAEDVAKINKINTLNLKEGDKIIVAKAIAGTAVKSFNETAVALAETVADSEWQFVQMMNKKAVQLKMMHTNFRNASGLHEDGQYTTNYDLARLVIALEKKFPQYRHFFSQKEFEFNGEKYITHNRVLLEYKGANGFKTGFTTPAGFNLIASAKRSNVDLVSILTGCESYQKRDEFTKFLMDVGFAENRSEAALNKKEIVAAIGK